MFQLMFPTGAAARYSPLQAVFLEIALAVFKIGWNYVGIPALMYMVKMLTACCGEKKTEQVQVRLGYVLRCVLIDY